MLPTTTSVTRSSTRSCRMLGGWRLARRLNSTRWFHIDLATPATCEPDWPADYVVKSVREEVAGSPLPSAALRRELEVAKFVCHPHLATVLTGQFENEPAYIVQPWYEGHSVRRWIDNANIGVGTALWIARQIAEALAALHDQAWMHGDVTPDNVIVSPLGHATIIDLGFAQRLGTGQRAAGVLQTTVNYAAPELFLDVLEPTSQADVYSLGATLYEMLAGRPPFTGSSATHIAQAHVHEIPADVRTLNPLVAPRVARLVAQLLAKEPQRRPAAADLVDELACLEIECFELV